MRLLISCAAATAAMMGSSAAAKTITVASGEDAQERLQEALIVAQPGDVVEIGEGRFRLTDGLSLDVDRVTVKGQGSEKTILDFTGQAGAGEGLLISSDDVVLREFAVENSKGDGIKSKGADRIVYHKLRVEWTGGPLSTNGAYGIYPVESKDVLIDSVLVRGASDAGIYVGQSRNIIVRGSTAVENVAGIEIENSYDADVLDNIVTKNTGGILVFDLPNLPQKGGHNVRIFSNIVINNMTPNFAPKGNIVASVPTGTGVMVMANRNVQIFDNVIGDNGTANVMVVGYRNAFDDAEYDPIPSQVAIWDNQHLRSGWAPDFPGGFEIMKALGGNLPPIFWDGSGGSDYAPSIADNVAALNLGLTDIKASPVSANPVPLTADGKIPAELPAITLPGSMEAVVQ
ncbi:parallel beta-helix domain-containing protein [Sphingorhabdus arenilitoris]|uniref:Parallel beta-helix domain-containing protein n=1 Tax=Sphingorhabdus arenilitoris TaxID=1490041 RepID=A0ABV8RG61_9SPHN